MAILLLPLKIFLPILQHPFLLSSQDDSRFIIPDYNHSSGWSKFGYHRWSIFGCHFDGAPTLDEINNKIEVYAREIGVKVETFQSNWEGELVDKVQEAKGSFDALVINPAAYTHTSIALRDAVSGVGLPTIEVHLSNIYQREEFRKISYLSEVVEGKIVGLGVNSYLLGLKAVVDLIKNHT